MSCRDVVRYEDVFVGYVSNHRGLFWYDFEVEVRFSAALLFEAVLFSLAVASAQHWMIAFSI